MFVAILVLGFIVSKFFSFVMVNGAIQHASPMIYAFIFPFAVGSIGIYKNITPVLYYFVALLLVVFINKKNIENNIDLS